MRLLIFSIAVLGFVPVSAQAEDAYGERFANTTPPGLKEHTAPELPQIAMDEIARDLQDVMPAAGEAEDEEMTSEEAAASEDPQVNTDQNTGEE